MLKDVYRLIDAKARVYLPKDRTWIDAERKEFYEGGQWITVETPMETIPVFTDLPDLAGCFSDDK